jgi:SAM-dependent methyltransferase
MKMCEFLQDRSQVDATTTFLSQHGFYPHSITPKNWDLAHILPDITEGPLLDMGCCESYILGNAKIIGPKFGIDMRLPGYTIPGVTLLQGDLMDTRLPPKYFQTLTCISVIEHGVDFGRFAAECVRLLRPGGKLYVSFDYWNPKITGTMNLYGLAWNILCRSDVEGLIQICEKAGMMLTEEVDWSIKDAVINEAFYAPRGSGVAYTFGLLTFVAK